MYMMLLLVSVGIAMLEPGVNPFALAVQVTVDLLALFLEVAGLAIFTLCVGLFSLAIEMSLDAIPFGVHTLFDALTLRCVAVMISVVATLGHSIVNKKQQENCQCSCHNFFHSRFLSLVRVIALFC